MGHSLCVTAAVSKQSSLNQAAYVTGSTEYRYGHNSILNMKVYGAPADTGYGRVAMLHDGSMYRLYLFKRGSRDTIYQFGFNRSTNRYEYGYNSIKVLKIVGMPADASNKGFAMLHDGKDYRLYQRSKDGKKLYQAAYKAGSNSYVYGYNSIKVMNITGAPATITNNGRWAMLHDGKDYRLYIGRKGHANQFYQFAFDGSGYKHGYKSIPLLKVTGMPNTSKRNSFAMLHDRSAYRYYYKTK
ncbi:hypothetical protein DKT75_13730 [Leucothrix arctica]|uniref:Uncharacterized protein n=1 Tax=Leucothrix arctica TaxID=1481894 RepID=A0A317C8Z5_9GAMM|nr:hypothetical protein DKT75_13730 [Leucothrix arctica]